MRANTLQTNLYNKQQGGAKAAHNMKGRYKMGKTSSAVKNRYNAKVYDRVLLAIPKGLKDEWKARADENGESLTKFVMNAVEAYNK